MGPTYTTVLVRPLSGVGEGFAESFLVDTGAIDCVVSAAKLRAAGIEPEGKDTYELADGRSIEMLYGFARVTILGAETVTKVAFAPEGAESILGVVALESIGIGVDPVTRAPKKMAAKPLKAAAPPA